MNFKFFTFLTALILTTLTIFAQNRAVNDDGYYKGVIRVKVDNNMVQQFEALHAEKTNSVNSIKATNDFVVTNISSLDEKNSEFGAFEYKRVFRYAGKFEARHRKHDLHKWYEISFNSKAPVNELIAAYK
ncbi:MAG: hypothetical protein PF489_11755, partial [Salinivirgaceae bacterium]|nr:hypothetical protein [Salinivirgaceae bacterium]